MVRLLRRCIALWRVGSSILLHLLKARLHRRLLHSIIYLLNLLLDFILVFIVDYRFLCLVVILTDRFHFHEVGLLRFTAGFGLLNLCTALLCRLILISFLDGLILLLVVRQGDFDWALDWLDVLSLFQVALSCVLLIVVV